MKFLVTGLGNPGFDYIDTRHNIGFKVLDSIAENLSQDFETCRYGLISKIKYISFNRNYGHQSAILAGLENFDSNYYLIMDTDLQHDPKYIIDIYNKLNSGYEICYVKYLKRKHLKWKIFVSKIDKK